MVIPKHSKFRLYTRNYKDEIFNSDEVNFILEEDVTITAASTFDSIYPTPDNSIMDLMGIVSVLSDDYIKNNPNAEGWSKVLRGFARVGQNLSGKYKEFGFQVYKRNDPLKLKLNLSLYATYNAKKQVFIPAKQLMLLPLPTNAKEQDKYNNPNSLDAYKDLNNSNLTGIETDNSNSAGQLFSPLIPPGPSVIGVLNENYENKGRVFSCSIGDIFFDDVFITDVDFVPNVQKMKDKDGNFYPMSAKVSVGISSMYIMTRGVVYEMMGSGSDAKDSGTNAAEERKKAQEEQNKNKR